MQFEPSFWLSEILKTSAFSVSGQLTDFSEKSSPEIFGKINQKEWVEKFFVEKKKRKSKK